MELSKNDLLVTLKVGDFIQLISEEVTNCLKRVTPMEIEAREKPDEPVTELISRVKVAEMFGVSTTTIDKWRKFKFLPKGIKQCSRVYFLKAEIIELLKSKQRFIQVVSNNLKSGRL
jgi:hypothetical protein